MRTPLRFALTGLFIVSCGHGDHKPRVFTNESPFDAAVGNDAASVPDASDTQSGTDAGATGNTTQPATGTTQPATGTTTQPGDAGGPVVSNDAGSTSADAGNVQTGTTAKNIALPPVNAGLDYQLGGAYTPPQGVGIVSRDRTESPAPGLYNICYVNGFQTQPGDASFWLNKHPTLVLRGQNGQPVIDPDWPDEMMLDVSTDAKRAELADIIGAWVEGCATDGFDAVEIDNLDTYTRAKGLIQEDDAVAFISLLSKRAHDAGLAIAQKNSVEIAKRKAEMGTDFAVAEECYEWDQECDDYIAAYGDHVLIIEYDSTYFQAACFAYPNLSVVLRDLDLVPKGDRGYVFDGC